MDVLGWLLESDPSIRWQVMRDLLDAPDDEYLAERRLVARTGWGARFLPLQAKNGLWGGGDYSPKWISTTYTLLDLRHLGVDPAAPLVRTAVSRVEENITSGRMNWPFFSYRGETCVTGMILALSSYFNVENEGVVDFLLDKQHQDGGWNCETDSNRSSFNTTTSVIEGLLEFERNRSAEPSITAARERAHEYLLDRKLMRRLSTGELINPRWRLFSFPPRWFYDVLRGLDYLRLAGVPVDDRWDEALDLVESKRRKDGRWNLQNPHRGRVHFEMEDGAGRPSRWNTLRAMRVLKYAGRSG